MSDYLRHQSSHKSLIKKEIYPDELGIVLIKQSIKYKIISFFFKDCISDDEYNHQISSSSINTSKQTITTQCQHNIITINTGSDDDDDNNNISSETIDQNSNFISPQSSSAASNYRYFSCEKYRLPSPSPCRKAEERQHISTTLRPSCSLNDLSHSSLQEKLTGDSGTGDSVEHLPIVTSTQPLHFEVVPIFGQDQVVALMANRYEFDQTKIDEYLRRKRKNFPKSLFFKQSPPTTETRRENNGASTNITKSPTKKSSSVFQRFRRKSKHSPTDEIFIQPIVRHHSSHVGSNENH
jgi:hypothetical protein